MQKKFLIPSLIVLFIIVVVSFFFFRQRQTDLRYVTDHSIVQWKIDGKNLNVEVVNTPESIELGLGGRGSIEADGMLFVFDEPVQPVFWMEDMKFPIDLYWIKDGKIIGFEKNLQPPKNLNEQDDLPKYSFPGYVDMVLEIPLSKRINLSQY